MSWYNSSWLYRVKITVDNTKVDADLTNFPVYVDLSNLPTGFHSHVNQTDARDIRVTKSDETTELPREVVYYDAVNDKGELHFKADSLANSTNTDFYIYYGNASASDYAATDTYGRNNVWDSNYKGVWHLKESPSGTTDEIKDSTSNGNDGTTNGSMDSTDLVDGKIGKALDFDGSNDYIDCGNNTSLQMTSAISVEAWIYPTATNDSWDKAVSKGENTWGLELKTDNSRYGFTVYSGGFKVSRGGTYTQSQWTYLVGTFDGTTVRTYVNGAVGDITASASSISNPAQYSLNIGRNAAATQYGATKIDEVRISNVARSSTWISTEYNNQSSPSTFYSVGSEETGATSANSERGLYVKGWDTGNSERSLYLSGSQILSTNYFKVGYLVESERGLYIKGKDTGSSDKSLYIQGYLTGDSERGLYIEGKTVESGTSERGLYITGSDVGASEKSLLLEGKPVVSERDLYLSGYIHTSSTRDLFLKGFDTGTGERGLYTQGTKSGASERSLYVEGFINTSERGLYIKGMDINTSNRGLYIQGCLGDSSERGLYLTTYALGGLERDLYTWGWKESSSARGVYLFGKDEGEEERGLYIHGFIRETGERGLYLYGIHKANPERGLYIQGRLQGASGRSIYTAGCIKVLEDRGLYVKGTWRPWVDKSVEYGTIYSNEKVPIGNLFTDINAVGGTIFTKNDTTAEGVWRDETASSTDNFTKDF